jgi:two-component system NtrC family sensor kinase
MKTLLPMHSLRTKLIARFSVVIAIGVLLFVVTGISVIGNTIIRQAQDKVRLDINSAREVYDNEAERIKDIVRLTAKRFFLAGAITDDNRILLQSELRRIMASESLDVLTLTDEHGCVLIRARNPTARGDSLDDPLVRSVIVERQVFVGTQVVGSDLVAREGNDLAERAAIRFVPTPKARLRQGDEETAGMFIEAAAPVLDSHGNIIGVLLGGTLLNRNYAIVDRVKNIVYRGEQYRGRDIGTATIFQDDLRISTNVLNADGSRAIGTRVSEEVYNQVIGKGIPWVGRAFVVNAWYITAYEPIRNIQGDIIGVLYVGMLEAPYIHLRQRVVLTFAGIALLSVIVLSVIAYFSSTQIVGPISRLLFATNRVAAGDLSYRVQTTSRDEIGRLGASFNHMTAELEKVTEGYRTLAKTLEQKVEEKTRELEKAQSQLIQSEKLTSLGKMAAGIAHEVNNPLTSILLNSHLIAEKVGHDSSLQENVKLIIEETKRCSTIVKGLLEFSRQSMPEKQPASVNRIIEDSLLLLESQVLIQNVAVKKELLDEVSLVMVDSNKIKQVFTNIILNALDAMPGGGTLTITTRPSDDNKYIEVEFTDTGCGIQEEDLGKIFDPFYTTKGVKGSGLGLAISYGIIEQHSGTITAKSEKNKGATFAVRLPVFEREPKEKQ